MYLIDTSIVQEYLNGASLSGLSKKYDISTYILKKELVKNGIKIRSRNEQNKYSPQNQRKFEVNDLYFSKQSPNMAYLLGMFAADGCVYEKTNAIKLTLASADKEYLELIKKEMSIQSEIKDYETSQGYKNSELRFSSFQIKKDFADYNITPRKTYHFKFPQKLKKEYYKDFIRGYFDGDGCVSTAGKNAIRWQLSSHEKEVLQKVLDFFEEYDIPKVSIQKITGKELYYIQYSTTSTYKIYNILYYENCFHLPRKKRKYESLMK